MTDPWQRRPPEHTLRWAAEAISSAATVASVRRLALGGWHVNHALTVSDGAGKAHRLVLRRWARPHWAVEDPDLTAAREATVLELLAPTPVPAPRLIAADPDATTCDVPTLLISHLPGHPPGLPADIASFLARLAEALPTIHDRNADGLPGPVFPADEPRSQADACSERASATMPAVAHLRLHDFRAMQRASATRALRLPSTTGEPRHQRNSPPCRSSRRSDPCPRGECGSAAFVGTSSRWTAAPKPRPMVVQSVRFIPSEATLKR